MKYMAIDFETGNSSPLSACAIGVAVFQDTALVRHEAVFIKPPCCAGRFHWSNIRINGIWPDMVADAPAFDMVWARFAQDAEGSIISCHNAQFDISVLNACLAYYHLPTPECRYVCTVKVARRVWPELENCKLNTVSKALGIPLNHHEASSDARACGLILQAALRETHSRDIDELAQRIGMRIGRISCMGTVPCSIAKKYRQHSC